MSFEKLTEDTEKIASTDASSIPAETGDKPEIDAGNFGAAKDEDSAYQELEPIPAVPVETPFEPVDEAKTPESKSPEPKTPEAKTEKSNSKDFTAPQFSNLLTTAVSITWIAGLIHYGAAQQSLPWCITLAGLAVWAMVNLRGRVQKHALAASRIGTPENGRLTKAFSTTYLATSLLMFSWFSLHGFKMPPPLVTQRQFIDIELTSFADFKDNDELTASTEEKDSQRKRTGSTDRVAMAPPSVPQKTTVAQRESRQTEEAGKRAMQSVAPKRQTTSPTQMVLKGVQIQSAVNSANADVQAQQQKAEDRAKMISQIKLPSGWKSVQADQPTSRQADVSPGMKSKPTRSSNQSMFMEEASPVELFEVADNEGDTSMEIFQAGGRSTGGKGAPSTLQDYLKLLHKRIKRAWSPPNGDPRIAQILFRVDRNGKLKQIRLIRSSGNSDCDEAAMNAIAACTPFKNLPADFPSDCLDIKYTFNYKVDSLSEVPRDSVQ